MKKFINLQKLLLMLFLCLFIFKASGQTKFDKTSVQLAEIKKLKAKVEADPSDLKLHEAFIEAYNPDDPALETMYRTWMQKLPKTYAVPFSIGKVYIKHENPKGSSFILAASVLKPDQAEIWSLLADDAMFKNDISGRQEYLKKAMQCDPKDADYAFYYASSFEDTDPARYDSLSLEVAKKFPDNERGAQALYWLADKSTIPAEKIAYYKQIYNRKSNQLSEWYLSGMLSYFDYLLENDPNQAFELGVRMAIEGKRNLNLWKDRIKIADAFLKVKNLMVQSNAKEALSLLNSVVFDSPMSGSYAIYEDEYLKLFKAEVADAAGQTKMAYDSLTIYYSKEPSDKLHEAVFKYGSKLGMDSNSTAKSIWKIRESQAKQATDFSLDNYLTKGKTALSYYKGKVVLLTYWFPGCGPCRGEFPHFEAVLKKFSKNDIAYLGLNLEPSQNDFVLPFLKKSNYSFTPLQDSWGRQKGNLAANGAPANYLIDQKGRIVFSNFRIDADNEKTLELMIKETLATKEE